MRYKVVLLALAVGISLRGIVAGDYAVAVYWAVLAAYWCVSIRAEWDAAMQKVAEGLKDEEEAREGWRVLRCTDTVKAGMIADAMQAACDNAKIGYDQGHRLTLYDQASKVGFDPGKVTVACETDCSALVRVCLAYAGITVGNFRTPTQRDMMMATGMFVELIGTAYTDSSDYLRVGDVLVTRTQGHTVVVLSNGPLAAENAPVDAGYELGDRMLKKGCVGPDVQELQKALAGLGYDGGTYGADGDFGSATERAVKAFQTAEGLEADGKFGAKSYAALLARQAAPKPAQPEPEQPTEPSPGKVYTVTGGTVWIWDGHSAHGGEYSVIVRRGDKLPALDAGEYVPVVHKGAVRWINRKYITEG